MKRIHLLYLILFILVCSPWLFGAGFVFDGPTTPASTSTVAYLASTGTSFTLTAGVTTQTIAYNSGSTGSNRVLMIPIALFGTNAPSISGIKYNGVAAVHATGAPHNNGGTEISDLWYVVAPATGSNNYVVTWGTSLTTGKTGTLGSAVFTGVNQTTPLGTAVTGTTTGVSVTIPSGGGAIDIVGSGVAISAPSQTQLFIDNTPYEAGASQYSITPGTTTFSWTNMQVELAYPINHQ